MEDTCHLIKGAHITTGHGATVGGGGGRMEKELLKKYANILHQAQELYKWFCRELYKKEGKTTSHRSRCVTSPVQQLPFSAADRSNGHAVITLWPFQVVLRAPRLLQTTRRPLDLVKRRTLKWHDHVSRSSGLAKTILQGTEKGEKDKTGRRRRGKITSGNGQTWSSPSPRGQWRTDKNGGNGLWSHLWYHNVSSGQGIGEGVGEFLKITSQSFAC